MDRRGHQAVDVQAPAQQLEHFELRRSQRAVRRGDIAGEGVGGLAQRLRQTLGDHLAGHVEAVLAPQQVGAVPTHFGQSLVVEAPKHG